MYNNITVTSILISSLPWRPAQSYSRNGHRGISVIEHIGGSLVVLAAVQAFDSRGAAAQGSLPRPEHVACGLGLYPGHTFARVAVSIDPVVPQTAISLEFT